METFLKDNPLRRFREEYGYSRSDVARCSGISYSTLSNIEQGLVHEITVDVREKLMAFGFPETIDMEYLEWKHAMQISTGSKNADVTARQIEHRRQLAEM